MYSANDGELTEMCILRENADPEGYSVNTSAFSEMQRIAKAANMDQDFIILQQSFFGRKSSTDSIPRTLLNNGDVVHSDLSRHDSATSGFSVASSSDSFQSHVSSSRSVNSNILQSSFGSREVARYLSMTRPQTET